MLLFELIWSLSILLPEFFEPPMGQSSFPFSLFFSCYVGWIASNEQNFVKRWVTRQVDKLRIEFPTTCSWHNVFSRYFAGSEVSKTSESLLAVKTGCRFESTNPTSQNCTAVAPILVRRHLIVIFFQIMHANRTLRTAACDSGLGILSGFTGATRVFAATKTHCLPPSGYSNRK